MPRIAAVILTDQVGRITLYRSLGQHSVLRVFDAQGSFARPEIKEVRIFILPRRVAHDARPISWGSGLSHE